MNYKEDKNGNSILTCSLWEYLLILDALKEAKNSASIKSNYNKLNEMIEILKPKKRNDTTKEAPKA